MQSAVFSILCVSCFLLHCVATPVKKGEQSAAEDGSTTVDEALDPYKQHWGYVDVRKGAHSFWWLFQSIHEDVFTDRPLIMWLQGGPGASSTGIGNFELIGPIDSSLEERNFTWLQEANLLFVDNPVGTGYSYVDSNEDYATDTTQIAEDLLTLLKSIYKQLPDYQKCPFYIFGESYGGKMAAVFAERLDEAIKTGELSVKFEGFAMGNSWISPEDSTLTWGPLLHWMSIVDEPGLEEIQKTAYTVKEAIDKEQWFLATQRWSQTQRVVMRESANVDFYNILNYNTPATLKMRHMLSDNKTWFLPQVEVPYINMVELSLLMNTDVKEYLGIPDDVIWGGQSSTVFVKNQQDFMKPVIENVDRLLNETNLDVIVYQGQLDLICDNKAAMDWVQKFGWPGLEGYNKAERIAIRDPDTDQPETFVKAHKNFKFYWNLEAGHTVPRDQGFPALRMLRRILDDVDN